MRWGAEPKGQFSDQVRGYPLTRFTQFFVNFVQAASLFTLYTFATLLAYTVRDANRADGHVDPQELVIIAL